MMSSLQELSYTSQAQALGINDTTPVHTDVAAEGVYEVRVASDVNCYVEIGKDAVATLSSAPVHSNNCECYFKIAPGERVSFLAFPGTSGTAWASQTTR